MPKRRRSLSESGTQRYLGGPFKALLCKHSRQSTVEGPLSEERQSSEACQRRASLLVHTYMFMFIHTHAHIGVTEQACMFLGLATLCSTLSQWLKEREEKKHNLAMVALEIFKKRYKHVHITVLWHSGHLLHVWFVCYIVCNSE